jgi:short-subunit dehydrogenase
MRDSRPLALVTGASSGIGAAYARHLAARGYDLALVARRRERLEELAAELRSRQGVEAEVLATDLTREADLKRVEDYIAGAPNLEFLLNNAGFGLTGRFFEMPLDGQEAMHRLHIMATLRLTHAALPAMTARRKGAVVNVSSVAAFAIRPGNTSYHASKAWINSFSEGLYVELKSVKSPVRVQALCPGYTVTEFHDVMGMDRKRVFFGFWMSVDDVVRASLKGLARDKLFVVPGWPYKLAVLLLRVLPRWVLYNRTLIGLTTPKPN